MDDLIGKTVLVTGATGFVGGVLARRLAAEKANVRALARSAERARRLDGVDRIQVVMGNLLDLDSLRAAMQGCQYVFHVGAELSGPFKLLRPANVDGSRHVMEAAAEQGVSRVVHVSTIGVYGSANDPAGMTEDRPLTPSPDPYSITKAEAENAVLETCQSLGLSYSILRPGMIYGPGSWGWTARLYKLARNRPVLFFGDGSGLASTIFIDDLVDLLIQAAIQEKAHGQAFNAVFDPSPTWRQVLLGYARLAGHQSWLGVPVWLAKGLVKAAAFVASKDSMIKLAPVYIEVATSQRQLRMDKARDLLGWTPRVSLDEGIQRCKPWLREIGLLK
jgi:nucleoside-diphosphate-sugar epimerase